MQAAIREPNASAPTDVPVARRSSVTTIATIVVLAVLAIEPPLLYWIHRTLDGYGQSFNDFHDYWLASKLVLEGRSPYDLDALKALGQAEGRVFVLGTGYSYLPPFAVVMIPFALLPFDTAVLAFNGLSLVVFGLTVAGWIVWAHPETGILRKAVVALIAGAFPPVYGTIANGQANLVVLAPFALGVAAILRGGRVGTFLGGVAVGLAGVVKLVPAAVALPQALGRRWLPVVGVIVGFVGSVAVAGLAVPVATSGSGDLADLVSPDPYFTNQSINGFVTRIVRDSDRTKALFPGAFDPLIVGLAAAVVFGLVTLLLLWRARHALVEGRGLALGMALITVAAVAAAPKNAIWNEALVLVGVGLLLVVLTPDLRLSRLDRIDRWLLAAWLLGVVVQTYFWEESRWLDDKNRVFVTLIQSAAFYGLLALWVMCARHVRRLRT
jgi:Glycosyltransferase family 87